MNVLWDLFRTFAKIGMFTFGGGYAMISIIEDMCVARRKWISHDAVSYTHLDVYKRQFKSPAHLFGIDYRLSGMRRNGL